MAFNPDTYLSGKTASGFNPDTYLSSKVEPEPIENPRNFLDLQNEYGLGRMGAEGVQNKPAREFMQTLNQSIAETNEFIDKGGLQERYRDLPMEAVSKIRKKIQGSGAGFDSRRMINLERIRLDNPALAQEIEEMPAWEAFAIGSGKATEDLYQGAGRLIGLLDQEDVRDSPEYQSLASVRPAAGRGEMATNIAAGAIPATKVAKIAAPVKRIGAGLGLGSAEGGIPALGRGEDVGDVAKQAALGAGLQVLGGEIFNYGKLSPKQKALKAEMEANPRNPDMAKFEIVEGSPVKTKRLKEAVKQVGDPALVQMSKAASAADKTAIRKMLLMTKKAKKDPQFAQDTRIGEVVGKSLTYRVKDLRRLNRQAGTKIDQAASQLKGKEIDISAPVQRFKGAMDELRVNYDPKTGALDFTGSALEGSGGAATRDLIQRLAVRLKKSTMDASDAHFMKRLIDKDVTFGKSPSGIAGEIDDSVKGLRHDINEVLRDNFDGYRAANVKYKETLDALENLQKSAGGTIDLTSPAGLGVSLRKLTSNAQGRDGLRQSLKEIRDVLEKSGVKYKDDISTQIYIVNALERRFKFLKGDTALEKTIAGGVSDVPTSGRGMLMKGAEKVAEAVSRVDDEKAIEALLRILGEQQ